MRLARIVVVLPLLISVNCRTDGATPGSAPRATAVYNERTGRLEQLASDRDGDGKIDTRGHMDGLTFKSVEIDRDGDGKADRWEYYDPAPRGRGLPILVRAEESNGSGGAVTRREFYAQGVLQRVEEDADGDGRVDKWELYEAGALVRMDLDLVHRGTADRRLIYGRDGNVDRVEVDPDGDGTFSPAPAVKKTSR